MLTAHASPLKHLAVVTVLFLASIMKFELHCIALETLKHLESIESIFNFPGTLLLLL